MGHPGFWRACWLGVLLLGLVGIADASGPRYVKGPPFFTGTPGLPIGWKQTTLLYSTDPGALGTAVDHAASDALVAAAAGVWNVPVASITVAQGAPLAAHVSGQNVYLSTSGLVWPDDVDSTNAAAVPLAVVYDTDGSVTDTLLGAGASDPLGCQQNAVTETVDKFDPAGYIVHAVIVINGRCSGPLAEQQLQLQYQLERIFGRVLGLAWSQVNDNVFTGTPTPNIDQAEHWPIMHPIDILCGPYSYQCLPNPFTLRPDDVAGLVGIYPIPSGATPAPGKQLSLLEANPRDGFVKFPSGEGMVGVNILCQRGPRYQDYVQDWYETSAVSGGSFQTTGVSPFVAADLSAWGSFGSTGTYNQAAYFVPYFQVIDPYGVQGELIYLEPINPLYVGSASIGPYPAGMVAPAGSMPALPDVTITGPIYPVEADFTIPDAPATCGNGLDGTAAEPVPVVSTGWWNGVICGYGHASYASATLKPGRSLTVEVTALDANGFATTTKLMPAIGLFAPTDAVGALPSLGVAAAAFQGLGVGTTVLQAAPFAAGSGGGTVRIGIADQRGDGRPDFPYQARLFYADTIAPAEVSPAGGTVTINGMGFRVGNAVTINGVPATVVNWTSTSIVLTAPTMALAGAADGVAVDVVVSDDGTGAVSTMTAALTYVSGGALPDVVKLVSAPSGSMFVGDTAGVPFAVQVFANDGVTPAPNKTVAFSATAGSAQFGACGTATVCSVASDANGMASTAVSPQSAGTVSIQAAAGQSAVSASFATMVHPNRMIVDNTPSDPSTVGVATQGLFKVQILGPSGNGIASEPITFSVTQGSAIFGQCNASPCSMTSNSGGQAWMQVTLMSAGPVTIQATDGNVSQSITLTGIADVPQLKVLSAPSATGYVNASLGRMILQFVHGDGVTPFWDIKVALSGPAGMYWDTCGSNNCTGATDNSGEIASTPWPTAPGTYVLTASALGLSTSFTAVVTVRAPTLNVLSAPSGSIPVGTQAPAAFTVQLLDALGNPMGGQKLGVGGDYARVRMGCGAGTCNMTTDSNGRVSSPVTPLTVGEIAISAAWENLVASATFTGTGQAISFRLLQSPPATVHIGDKLTFQYEAVGTDGVTPLANQYVYLYDAVGTLSLSGCIYVSCGPSTDGNGLLTLTATPSVAGPVTLVALCDGLTQSVSFNVLPNAAAMNVVSAPSGTVATGQKLAVPFAVQVVEADGKTPVSGQNVAFSVVSGSAVWSACPSATCVVQTNAQGMASTSVTAGAKVGAVTLTAVDNGFSAAAGFNVVAPDVVSLESAPVSVFEGATATTPFAVRVTAGDGVTPVAGVPVTVGAAGAGWAIFTSCGQKSCTQVTDGTGSVSSAVAGVSPGAVTLTATAQLAAGNEAVAAPFTVVANLRSVTALVPQIYLAAGARVGYSEEATAVENGAPAASVTLTWSGGTGITLAAPASATDASGKTAVQATAGPLQGGVSATGQVCGWISVCGSFSAYGVAAGDQRIAVLLGGRQAVTAGAALQPVVLQVTDAAGHATAGATVTVGQTVYANDGSCPAAGRCPAAPVLASGSATLTSDLNGNVSVQPMALAGVATTTAMAFSVGSQGFATAEVSSTP